MKKLFFTSITLLFLANQCLSVGFHGNRVFNEINHRNHKLVQCWNNSNLSCVVKRFYSHNIVYTSSSGPIVGRKKLYNIFYKTFKDKKNKINMGCLKVKFLYFKQLDSRACLLIEKYQVFNFVKNLKRTGYASLIWEKKCGRWYIVADHPKDVV